MINIIYNDGYFFFRDGERILAEMELPEYICTTDIVERIIEFGEDISHATSEMWDH